HSDGKLLKVMPAASVPVWPAPVPAFGPCGRHGFGNTMTSDALPAGPPANDTVPNCEMGAETLRDAISKLLAGILTHKWCAGSNVHKDKVDGRTGEGAPAAITLEGL